MSDDSEKTHVKYEAFLSRLRQKIETTSSSTETKLRTSDAMREWIFRNTPRASCEQKTLCLTEPYPYKTTQILHELRSTKTGYWCAGHASLLVCAYRDLGLQAATIAFGVESLYTHALTLVKIENDWFLQDPYSNIRFGLEGETHSSFARVWSNIHAGQNIHSLSSPSRVQPFIFCDEADLDFNVVLPYGWHHLDKQKKIGLAHISIGQFYQHPLWPVTEPEMLRRDCNDPITSLFRTPLWLSDPKYGYSEQPERHPLWLQIVGKK